MVSFKLLNPLPGWKSLKCGSIGGVAGLSRRLAEVLGRPEHTAPTGLGESHMMKADGGQMW